MDRFDDDTLLAELREIRPEPRPEFAAELDEWAAAGFPRRDSRASKGRFATLAAHLRDLRGKSGGQWMVPAVGLAIAVLAVAGVVVAVGTNGGSGSNLTTRAASSESSGGGVEMGAGGEEAAERGGESAGQVGGAAREGKKSAEKAPATSAPAHGGTVHGGAELAETGEESFEEEPAEEAEESAGVGAAAAPSFEAATNAGAARGHRDVERSSSIVLGTKPSQVAGAAAKVYAAVHAADGIGLNSSVESGRTGPTGASFSLLIPSRKLDDALAEFSKIAEVRSRHDATNDITAPTVGMTEELRDSNAS